MSKSALIVDDSPSARAVLKRMLETYDLAVDSCESAEDALEYLEARRPDVIFMDHLMPGMDGFEAVSVIKKNPDTAMIPIMMYTSQEGEVYVGQARALGAVGVLPKTVQPVEVSKILESLHLVEEGAAVDGAAQRTAEQATDAPATQSETDIRTLLEDLFDQQRVILQNELRETSSRLATQFENELRRRAPEEAPADEAQDPRPRGQRYGLPALLALAALLAAVVVWQRAGMLDLEQENRALSKGAATAAAGTSDAGQSAAGADLEAALADHRFAALEALEWGANLSGPYGFDEIPLGDYRRQIFDELLVRLMAIGFTGVVMVDVHVGDFCMMADSEGRYRLAAPQFGADYCDAIGLPAAESLALGNEQSIGFANFLRTAEERSGGTVRFEIVSRGNADPLFDYPSSTTTSTAGEWNAIAALNNRVEIRLRPEAWPASRYPGADSPVPAAIAAALPAAFPVPSQR